MGPKCVSVTTDVALHDCLNLYLIASTAGEHSSNPYSGVNYETECHSEDNGSEATEVCTIDATCKIHPHKYV